MKVLIACEESQTVCKAFRALGHEAYSCDGIAKAMAEQWGGDVMEISPGQPGREGEIWTKSN